MTATVRVIGVPALLSRFVRAAALGEVAKDAAVDTLGEEVADRAHADVPVDTGATRDSIAYAHGVVSVGTDYANIIEYDQHPFLRPAADTVNDEHALGIAAAVMRTA
jgi:hypothetical protein